MSNRLWIVPLLAALTLLGRADAQEGIQKNAPNPYLMGNEGYGKGHAD